MTSAAQSPKSLRSRLRSSTYENPCDVWLTQEDIENSIKEETNNLTFTEEVIQKLAKEYIEKSDDFSTKPWNRSKFLTDSENRCWMDDSGRVRCLPSFYLAGFPKCGTTDLWKYLSRHERILGDVVRKEPNWWCWRRIASDVESLHDASGASATRETILQRQENRTFDSVPVPKITMEDYFDNFRNFRPGLLVGDASVDTMYKNDMFDMISSSSWTQPPSKELMQCINDFRLLQAHLIQQYTPSVKYVTILRDPVERTYSAYLFIYHYRHTEKRPSQDEFHKIVVEAINRYKQCLLEGGSVRFCAYSGTNSDEVMSLQIGQYILYLTDLIKIIGRANLLVLYFDDYRHNRAEVVGRIWDFLGLEKDEQLLSEMEEKRSLEGLNSSKVNGQYIGPMWEKTGKLLKQFYRPFNQALSKFLDDDKFLFE